MTSIGFSLIALGFISAFVFRPEDFYMDWKDYACGVPILIGAPLFAAGIAKWLWLTFP